MVSLWAAFARVHASAARHLAAARPTLWGLSPRGSVRLHRRRRRRLDDLRRQEMEDAPGLTGMAEQGLADEFDFGAIGDELGPETPSKFAQQLSGETNTAVMEQFPEELGSGDLPADRELAFEAEEIGEQSTHRREEHMREIGRASCRERV